MSTRSVVGLAYGAILFFVILPMVATHYHLYADGSYFLAKLLETGQFVNLSLKARFFHHLVTQSPVLIARTVGVLDTRALSWTYGLALLCFPWAFYLSAAVLFLNAGMTRHALLVTIAYVILFCLTGIFAAHEANLGTALFVLSLAVMTRGKPCAGRSFLGLLAICAAGLSCYEYWAAFFPVVFVVFLQSTHRLAPTRLRSAMRLTLGIFCVGGSVWNVIAIAFTTAPATRNALLGSDLRLTWPLVAGTCVLFAALCGVSGIYSLDRVPLLHGRLRDIIVSKLHRLLSGEKIPTFLAALVLAVSPVIYLPGIVEPSQSYALRSLNLFIPLMLAASLYLAVASRGHGESPGSPLRDRVLQYCLIGLLALTVQSHLYHTVGWLGFRHRLVQATQLETGYVPQGELRYFDGSYGWGWTYPTMSILFAAIEGKPIKAIVFNPNASWQPFGPSAAQDAKNLAAALRVPFEVQVR